MNEDNISCAIFSIIFAFFIVMSLVVSPTIAYNTDTYITKTVKKSERVQGRDANSGAKYLIFTEDEVLENTDTVWYWKYNSSDIYSLIEPGKTYKFRVYGFRIYFFSWYRNIISVEEVSK